MVKKLESFLSRAFLALIAIIIIAIVSLYAWVITGPRDLSEYIPYIEEPLNDVIGKGEVKIASLQISWGGFKELLKVEAFNTRLTSPNGKPMGTISSLELDYDISSLVLGKYVPNSIKIDGADVTLSKDFLEAEEKVEDSAMEIPDVSALKEITVLNSRFLLEGYVDDLNIDHAIIAISSEDIYFNSMLSIGEFKPTTIDGNVISKQGTTTLYGNIKNLEFAEYSSFLPELAGVKLDSDLKFVISFVGSELAQIEANIYDVQGTVRNDILRNDFEIAKGELHVVYSFANREIKIPKLDVIFTDDVTIKATASLIDGQGTELNAQITNLAATEIVKYWPKDTADNAINWIVEHVKGGAISKADINFKLTHEEYINGIIPNDSLDMTIDYDNLYVDYLPNRLLPAKELYGSLRMNANVATLGIARGEVGDSYVTKTEIEMSGLNEKRTETIKIKGNVAGPVADVADFYEKLGKGEKYFAKDDLLSGKANTDVELTFPLLQDLLMDEVDFDINSSIKGAAFKQFMGFAVSNFDMDLAINTDGTVVKGSFLASKKTNSGTYSLNNMITAFDLKVKEGVETMDIIADLQGSSIFIEPIAFAKKAGVPAKLTLKKVTGNGFSSIPVIKIESPVLNLVAKAEGDFESIKNITISRLDFANYTGTSNLEGVVAIPRPNNYAANTNSSFFDLRPLLAYMKKEDDGKKDDSPETLNLEMFFTQLALEQGQRLSNANVRVVCYKDDCQTVQIKSDKLDFNLENNNLSVRSGDTALLLKGFDIYDFMQGGDLEVNALKANGNYAGDVNIRDFRIVKGNVLTKILTVGSLNAFADTLAGKGMLFKKLSMKFVEREDLIEINDFRMYGNAVGVTANGWINTENDTLDIKGNIIPSYTANTILGRIPILGNIIIGDEGIFALSYTVKGSMENPEVAVNPLSVLAPGIIKNVFN